MAKNRKMTLTIILGTMVQLDEALNHEMMFIAIDMSTFKPVYCFG